MRFERSIVSVHGPVPRQSALFHPTKNDPGSAVARRRTCVPGAYGAMQVLVQLIAWSSLATVPVPVPANPTVRVTGGGARLKAAVTVTAPDIVTMQEFVPEQPPPLQPANTDPCAAWASRVTV